LNILRTYEIDGGFLLGIFFDLENGRAIPPKPRLPFNELHGVIPQKTEHFKATAVRTSDIVAFNIVLFTT
jgi:hypothetical protein